MQLKEVILESTDISKALLEYVISNGIQNIVVGASSRSALMRYYFYPKPHGSRSPVKDFSTNVSERNRKKRFSVQMCLNYSPCCRTWIPSIN
jgi:K+-sensing histidine kinase KdpD